MMKKNNKGITLIEVVAVFAIMAVLVGGGVVVLGLLSDKDAKKCASEINSALNEYRIKAMSQPVKNADGTPNTEKFQISKQDSDYYVKLPGQTTARKVAGSKVTIVYFDSDLPGATGNVINATSPLELGIDRSSGAYKPLAGGQYCKFLTITQGKYVYRITFVPETGKHYISEEVK